MEEEKEERTEPYLRLPGRCYRRGDFMVKGSKRVEQLEHHDRQARVCYEAIEQEIKRLKELIERVRRGEYISECR